MENDLLLYGAIDIEGKIYRVKTQAFTGEPFFGV